MTKANNSSELNNSLEVFSSAVYKTKNYKTPPTHHDTNQEYASLKEKIREGAKPKPIKKSSYELIYQELKELNPHENIIWMGRSSQVIHLTAYVLCFLFAPLIIPLFFALFLNLRTKNTIYVLTQERLRVYSGIIAKRIDDLELYRVKDTSYFQPMILRFFKLSNIQLITSDANWQDSDIQGIENGIALREKIRKIVEAARIKKGVKEVDYYSRPNSPSPRFN